MGTAEKREEGNRSAALYWSRGAPAPSERLPPPLMMPLALNRWLAIAVVCVALGMTRDYSAVALALGVSHYTLGAWAERKRLVGLTRAPRTAVPLAALLGACLGACLTSLPSTAVTSSVHIALNDAYVFPRWYPGRAGSDRLAGARALFHLAAYAFILRHNPSFAPLPSAGLLVALLAAIAWAAGNLWWERRRIPRETLAELTACDATTAIAVVASLFLPITLLMVAGCHFAFWLFQPALKLRVRGLPGARAFLVTTGLSLAAVYVLTPAGGGLFAIPRETLERWFNWTGYFHVGMSLAVSSLNPAWVTWVFRGVEGAREGVGEIGSEVAA